MGRNQMKQKFLVPMLVLLAFGALLFFPGNSALALEKLASRDESTDTAVREADQPAHEGDGQVVQEEAPVEKEPAAEDKYTPPEVPEDDINRVESDYEVDKREEKQDLRKKGENKAPEGDVTTESDAPAEEPAIEPAIEDGSQHNQHEGEPSAESAPTEPEQKEKAPEK